MRVITKMTLFQFYFRAAKVNKQLLQEENEAQLEVQVPKASPASVTMVTHNHRAQERGFKEHISTSFALRAERSPKRDLFPAAPDPSSHLRPSADPDPAVITAQLVWA